MKTGWITNIINTMAECPDVTAEDIPDLIRQRQAELEQEPDATLSIYSHGMTLPTDKDYEV